MYAIEILHQSHNFFQPSVKLVSKDRQGSRVTKKYDRAQTPYQRLLASAQVSDAIKEALRIEYAKLDPVELLRQVEHQQNLLWQYAHRPATCAADNTSTQEPGTDADKVAYFNGQESRAEDANKVPYIEVG